MSGLRLSILSAVVVIVGLVAYATLSPKPVDWSQSYSKADKIPYGSRLLYDLLPTVFGSPVICDDETPYESTLQSAQPSDALFVYVADQFRPDEQSERALLRHCDRGAVVFIAARVLSKSLQDSLGVACVLERSESVSVQLCHPQLPATSYLMNRLTLWGYFDSIPREGCTVLGRSNRGQANYIRIQRGEGAVYLHRDPMFFTNYFVADSSTRPYVFAALSFLPKRLCRWDEYFKPNRQADQSVFRVVFNDSGLRSAYYLTLALVILFMLFHTKRYQRIVPVLRAPVNATVEFVQTVGSLYYQHRDSRSILQKMLLYFQDYLRTKYYLYDTSLNESTVLKVSAKSNIDEAEVRRIFREMSEVLNKPVPEDKDVLNFHKLTQQFKEAASTQRPSG